MNTLVSPGRAMALAVVVLLVAVAQAWGHEAHKQRAEEASQQPVLAEAPMPIVEPSAAEPRDHGSHQPATASGATETPAAAVENNVPKPLAWLGKFHPPVTHFPIALFSSAGLVGATGFPGGALIHGLDHYAW